jgi:hypothetical protein
MKTFFTRTHALLGAILLFVMALSACRKEADKTGPSAGGGGNNPTTFEQRIDGIWEVKLVQYSASLPLQQGLPPLTIAGADPSATGSFDIGVAPNTVNYNFRVTASIDLGFGVPFPLPITQNGVGTWAVSANKKTLTITQNNGQKQEFAILVDEPNVQVWQGTVPIELPLPGIGGGLTADAVITLVKNTSN